MQYNYQTDKMKINEKKKKEKENENYSTITAYGQWTKWLTLLVKKITLTKDRDIPIRAILTLLKQTIEKSILKECG